MISSTVESFAELFLKAMFPAALECVLPHPAFGLTGL